MKRRELLIGGAVASLAPGLTEAADALGDLLAQPGVHAIMRHALAPGTGDPADFEIGDCSTQRNLSDRGRAQARATGDRLRALGARFDRVLTSQWCRCRETARLLDLAPVEDAPVLNSFFSDRDRQAPQTEALQRLLEETPDGETLMLVTHQVNITAFLGSGVTSGEVFVFRAGARPERLEELLVPA